MSKSLIYTSTGDAGTTSLVGGKRVKKNHIRIEAYGTVDELNSFLGLIGECDEENITFIQNKLFNIGSYLATENEKSDAQMCGVSREDVARLERAIDDLDGHLPRLKGFVLPGGATLSSMSHVARTVCRRCERRIIDLSETADVDPVVLKFINRMSDYLFVLARFINVSQQIDEKYWNKDC